MANSKPGSSTIQNGSRQVVMSSAKQLKSTIPPEIQVLSAEELMDNNYDMEIEDLRSSASDYTDDSDDDDDGNLAFTGRTESVFGIAEPLTDRSKIISQFDSQSQQSEDDYLAVRQLALLENESEDISVCSDEERDIMAEIRAEITQKVREEMKSELEVYQQAKSNLNKDKDKTEDDDLTDVEPKLKEAILKMRKLDKILEKKIKREKEVKRERMMLEKRIEEELKNLHSTSEKKVTADEKKNTEKFLALTLPPSHNAGVTLEQPAASPVFQTQLPDDMEERQRARNEQSARSKSGVKSTASGASQSGATSVSGASAMTEDSTGKKVRRKKKKDFIQRNIQLASDAANIVAMTDDEKKRLEDLLNDLDTLPEAVEDDDSISNNTPNPYQMAVAAGDGFTPTPNQRQRLDDIDMRLQSLLPPDEYLSITSGSVNNISHRDELTVALLSSENTVNLDGNDDEGSVLFTRTNVSSVNLDADGGQEVAIGELALREAKEKREQQERLQHIEEELNNLTSAVEHEMDSLSLTDDQLNKLLDDCARTMSRATQETTSIASSRSAKAASRLSLYENAPRLPEPVLQKLLQDARKELAGEERAIDASVNRRDDIQLESFSEESTVRDSASSSHNVSNLSSIHPGSSNSLLRLRQSGTPSRTFSPKVPVADAEDRRPFLPEIDPKGRMSTQRMLAGSLNNEQATTSPQPVYRTLSEIYTVRNSLNNGTTYQDSDESDSDKTHSNTSTDDDDGDDDDALEMTPTPTPHPPSSGRRSGSQSHIRAKYH